MTLPEINFIIVSLSFVGTYYFITKVLYPYYTSTQILNRRLEKAGVTSFEDNFLKEQEALRLQRTASAIDSKLPEFFKYTPTFSTKVHNFLYRSGFLSYSRVFSFLFLAISFICYPISLIFFKPLSWEAPLFSTTLAGLTFFIFLKAREHLWIRKIAQQFPSALDIINRSLKAGLPLKRGITLVAEEMPNPIGGEFRYMEAQLQIGIPPKQVLTDASSRVTIEDFRLFTIALLLQQEMGGSLADIIVKLYDVLAEREKIRLKIDVLSTEAKTSSWIVSALPFLVAACLEYLNPNYLLFFIQTSEGNIMLAMIAFLSIFGILTIRRMTRFTEE